MTHSSRIYLAVEGIDGTGKSYVANHIVEKFKFEKLQEPSNNSIGSLIKDGNWDSITDFFLFMADRSQMLKELKVDGNLVSDRSLYSSFAYQGYYLKNEFRDIDRYFDFFMNTAKLLPMLPTDVIVLYGDVGSALDRVTNRGTVTRFEKKEYLEGVQELYFALKDRLKNVTFIDTDVRLEELCRKVDVEVTSLLRRVHPL